MWPKPALSPTLSTTLKTFWNDDFFRIAKEANLADKDVHPLTASCSGEDSNRDGMEKWNVHCDSNQNGKIDPG